MPVASSRWHSLPSRSRSASGSSPFGAGALLQADGSGLRFLRPGLRASFQLSRRGSGEGAATAAEDARSRRHPYPPPPAPPRPTPALPLRSRGGGSRRRRPSRPSVPPALPPPSCTPPSPQPPASLGRRCPEAGVSPGLPGGGRCIPNSELGGGGGGVRKRNSPGAAAATLFPPLPSPTRAARCSPFQCLVLPPALFPLLPSFPPAPSAPLYPSPWGRPPPPASTQPPAAWTVPQPPDVAGSEVDRTAALRESSNGTK